MKISSLENKLKKIGSELVGKSFVINSKKITVQTNGGGSDKINCFVYDQSNDSSESIYFDTFAQVQQHFA